MRKRKLGYPSGSHRSLCGSVQGQQSAARLVLCTLHGRVCSAPPIGSAGVVRPDENERYELPSGSTCFGSHVEMEEGHRRRQAPAGSRKSEATRKAEVVTAVRPVNARPGKTI